MAPATLTPTRSRPGVPCLQQQRKLWRKSSRNSAGGADAEDRLNRPDVNAAKDRLADKRHATSERNASEVGDFIQKPNPKPLPSPGSGSLTREWNKVDWSESADSDSLRLHTMGKKRIS